MMSIKFHKSRLSPLSSKVLISLATATVLLTGCGGGGGGSTPPADTTQTAYLIDSPVKGIDYTCGTITGTTDITGKFTYDKAKCSLVEFSLGGLVLGSIDPDIINTTDAKLTLQELAGTTREDVAHATVQKMAVLLQSLDSDGDSSNGIDINSTTRTNFALTGNLADKTDNEISTEITARGKTVKDKIQALTHLLTSTKAIASSTKIDLVPDAFSFTDLTGQALASVVESAPITVAGIDIASPISVSGGYYKIGSGAWTNQPSKVTNGQTVTLKGTASSDYATVTDVTLAIGGVSDTFSIATIGDTIPTAFTFTDVSSVALSTLTESNEITVAGLGIGVSATISVTGGEYSINGGTYTAIAETVSNNDTVKVRHTSSGSNNTATDTTLTIGGLSDTFRTTTAEISWKGKGYNTITSSVTGKVWLDRNLGATQVCTAYNDTACYGDYYQWGRDADGHQISNSATISTQASAITSVGDKFITGSSGDWVTADSDGALRSVNWSKTDGSSVCPIGYRVPTQVELTEETISNSADAFTKLKLPSAGVRDYGSGSLFSRGYEGYICSSSPDGSVSKLLYFDSGSAGQYSSSARAYGQSVRCIKAD